MIRIAELNRIEAVLGRIVPVGARILEIGAGTGWQARALAARGYEVSAIDISDSNHRLARIWPIVDFDGRHIPFADGRFDIVYSSNVLEHVHDLSTLNREIARVLGPGGHALHYVPTAAWRLWSLLAFYPALARDAWRRLARPAPARPAVGVARGVAPAIVAPAVARPWWCKLLRRIVPHAHGAEGSCLSELRRFRRTNWDAYFAGAGWKVMSYGVNGLCLSGDMLLGAGLPMGLRQRLSGVLGSTAHLYLLARVDGAEPC